MKHLNKFLVFIAVGGFMASCANQDIDDFVVEMPESLNAVEQLNSLKNIKDYVDRAAYPNFKIACALGAADYNARGVVYRAANNNFDEITLGNAMKYASVVGDDGSMNFDLITNFLDNVEGTGVSVYGHTLAWHAQQNTTYLKSLLADVPVPVGPEDRIEDHVVNFSDYTEFPFTPIKNFVPSINDGILYAECSNKKQFYIAEDFPTEPGQEYEIWIMIKGNKSSLIPFQFGAKGVTAKVQVTEEWSKISFKLTAPAETGYILVDPGNTKINLEIQYVNIGHYPPNSRPLTEEEKYDNLVNAMNIWCAGMMNACAGRVQSWDLINEAISGGGNVNGYYDLQHAAGGSSSDFFWQDYLGNENYGPVVEKAARNAYAEAGGNPADLKLFVNDYNLESDWDNNQKLKSLIYWVGVWEKGGAKIDGLSSQMHISYYEDKNTMKSKAKHMVNMLHLMANTGKLVRISELDMGYVDKDGNDVPTQDMTPEMHQNMANYYEFIIQMFLKIVPKDQQYGICQWCLTDSPAGSGWRANTPVGIWDLNWNRKAAYAAFCDAFTSSTPDTEDFFEYLSAKGLEHYISPDAAE